jgi:asparagine synthase (glutamine-hydrolysing)
MLNAYARLHGRRRIADDGIPRWSGVAPDFAREMQVRERARAFGADDARLARANAKEYRILALEAAGDGPDVTHAFRTRYGIDTLDPTSDIRVIDFCLSVPSTQYLRNGRDRWLVRRALRGMLPPSVVDRTTRGAQSADWTEWFEAMRPMIVADIDTLERSDTARRCLDVPRMARLVREWPARLGVEHTIEYNLMLLRAIVVGRFIRWFEERHA